MDKKIEYKIKNHTNKHEKWESLPARRIACDTAKEADRICKVILDTGYNVETVRWNWLGSLQGHYVYNHKPTGNDIEITTYNPKSKEKEHVVTLSKHTLGKALSTEEYIQLLLIWINNMGVSPEKAGAEWAHYILKDHCTLQQKMIGILFQTLYAIGSTENVYSDDRNKASIEACKRLAYLIDGNEVSGRFPLI